jgi:hypothetical protein
MMVLFILYQQAFSWTPIDMTLQIVCMPADIVNSLVDFYCRAWSGWTL